MITRGLVSLGPGWDMTADLAAVERAVAERLGLGLGLDPTVPLRLDFEVGDFGWDDGAEPACGDCGPMVGFVFRASRTTELLRDPGVTLDTVIGPADIWTPFAPGGGLFGDRAQAHALIGAPEVPHLEFGRGVNVVILDYGISRKWLRRWCQDALLMGSDGRMDGWPRFRDLGGGRKAWFRPGDEPPDGLTHGHMIARNVLSIAPAARIWDVPLLPDTALGPPAVGMANAILLRILRDIRNRRQRSDGSPPLPDGPWILVNAWGAFDPLELDLRENPDPDKRGYWNDPGYNLTRSLPEFGETGIDVIFAAGNCGTPGSHPLCGESFIGPGRSITGANASPDVLTVGAVRVDGLPIGASAQGPGALAARWLAMQQGDRPTPGPGADDARAKPDCSAPSHFRDPWSTGSENTGTSAACGVAAGVLAALRGLELAKEVKPRTPAEMRAVLRRTAKRPRDAGFDARLGWGVVNLAAARHELCL